MRFMVPQKAVILSLWPLLLGCICLFCFFIIHQRLAEATSSMKASLIHNSLKYSLPSWAPNGCCSSLAPEAFSTQASHLQTPSTPPLGQTPQFPLEILLPPAPRTNPGQRQLVLATSSPNFWCLSHVMAGLALSIIPGCIFHSQEGLISAWVILILIISFKVRVLASPLPAVFTKTQTVPEGWSSVTWCQLPSFLKYHLLPICQGHSAYLMWHSATLS